MPKKDEDKKKVAKSAEGAKKAAAKKSTAKKSASAAKSTKSTKAASKTTKAKSVKAEKPVKSTSAKAASTKSASTKSASTKSVKSTKNTKSAKDVGSKTGSKAGSKSDSKTKELKDTSQIEEQKQSADEQKNTSVAADAKTDFQLVEEDEKGNTRLIVDPSIEKTEYVQQALSNPDILVALIEALCGKARRPRQFAATILCAIAHKNAEILVEYFDKLVNALKVSEAQTRWETMDALYQLVPICKDKAKKVLPGAEASLYDEESGPVRLAAFRLMCSVGRVDPKLSKKVWPDIDEAIQCYHGDLEFFDMLDELLLFASGDVDESVKKQLAERMKFDAGHGKGTLTRKAKAIVDACK